ncbi:MULTISPECIES: efflux RND transporter permease subunit [Bacteroides]|uniref:efflux RND transporter permease subunit n=1 Tax=Bacteroides TaxID=816 RepID=UPI001CB7CDEE|nr:MULTISPECIES: efflux RND transporter permease subunit [Bacteroides]
MKTTKTGLVPQEDMGTIFVDVRTSPGNSLEETKSVMDEIDKRIHDIPQVRMFSKVTGNGMISGQGASNGMFIVRLKLWDERTEKEDGINAVINEIYRRTDDISSAQIMAFAQPMIPGYGVSSGFEIYIQDQKGGSVEDLLKYTRQMIDALNARPEIGRASTSFDTKCPQFLVEVDAALCKRNGVSPSDILSTLSGYIGGNYASNMNRFSKLYRVMVQASPEFRLDTEALNNMFVRNSNGEMSPVSQYLTLTRVYGAESLTRFNLFSAISVNGAPQLITRSTLDNQRFPESLSTGVPLQLLHRRPDIRQKEAELAEAFYATNQARSAFYPSITLGGSAGWTNSAGGAITNPGQWLLSTVGSLVQPLFNRGQNIANLKVAKAQQEEALLTFRQSLLDAGTEVNDALVQWQKAQGRLALSKQQVISLQSAVRSSELLMRHSSQNYLEVLTARQTLLQAELSVASNRFDEIQGVINLYHALGGGY